MSSSETNEDIGIFEFWFTDRVTYCEDCKKYFNRYMTRRDKEYIYCPFCQKRLVSRILLEGIEILRRDYSIFFGKKMIVRTTDGLQGHVKYLVNFSTNEFIRRLEVGEIINE